jgi:hypothetical protein
MNLSCTTIVTYLSLTPSLHIELSKGMLAHEFVNILKIKKLIEPLPSL